MFTLARLGDVVREPLGCFCFQAEDGIRDLVRSRGLGDVYKRQLTAAVLVVEAGRRVADARAGTLRHALEAGAHLDLSLIHI